MLLLPGENYKDRNTNTFLGEINEKLINLLLYYTKRSQNTMFRVVMLRI